jgi:poly-beta-1,6-N-acetyl-D-glucosamine synthase
MALASYIGLLAAAALVLYVLIGYPILLKVVPFHRRPPVAKNADYEPTVSVLLAVYNGEAFLRSKLECLLALDYPQDKLDIVIVSDGSTDATEAIAGEYADRRVTLLRQERAGKASALNRGFGVATGEVLFFTDVRQPLEPGSLRLLVANLADPTVGAVTGQLRLFNAENGEQADMDLYWRYEIWARERHSGIDSLFTATGCIYAMRRELAHPIPPDTLIDDAVLPLGAFFDGYRVVYEPAAIAYDYPVPAEFGRRLRTLAGLWQVHFRVPKLFSGANRMRFHFLSHKFGRLVLPWAIVLAYIATLSLPASPFRTILLAGESLLPILAALDSAIPKRLMLKRLTSPARTFLAMNLAAVLSLKMALSRKTRLWNPTQVKVR